MSPHPLIPGTRVRHKRQGYLVGIITAVPVLGVVSVRWDSAITLSSYVTDYYADDIRATPIQPEVLA